MAYVDFTGGFTAGDTRQDVALLTRAERQVVLLARRDTPSSLRKPRHLGRALRWLFKLETANRLADPRLEALRAFAVQTARSRKADLASLLEQGFSPAKIEQARWLASSLRRPRGRTARAVQFAIAGVAAALTYTTTETYLGDATMTAILSALVGLPLLSLVAGRAA